MTDEFPNFSLGIIEQFVFQLSCRKRAGFHGQQFGQFSLNLSYLDPLFRCFLRTESEH